MAKQLMPKAELLSRPSDVPLTDKQFLKIGLFAQLKRQPTLDKFPGALVLRRFRTGEVICRQGDAGWTAFYILNTEDLVAIEERPPAAEPDATTTLRPEEMRAALQRMAQLKGAKTKTEDKLRTAAIAHLTLAQPGGRERPGLSGRLRKRILGRPVEGTRRRPQFIPVDGPRELDSSTLQSPLYEGELFGEMSCLYRTPRSATIVATRDCYVLEMLRNILDQLQKDPVYKAKTDAVYRQRVLALHLRQLPLFADLPDDQLAVLRDGVELVSFDAGDIICDEHERSDSIYIVRSGLVKVVKKVSALLNPEAVRNWPGLCVKLREGENQPATPAGKVWQLLSEAGRAVVRAAGEGGPAAEAQRQELLHALNDVLKNPQLAEAKEFQEMLASTAFQARATDFPAAKRKEWPALELRRFHRILLETICGDGLRHFHRRVGPDFVLTYLSRSDFFGEAGLLAHKPRSATCIASGHPQAKEAGHVELVRLPEALFRKLVELSPALRQRLEAAVVRREKHSLQRAGGGVWEDSGEVHCSKRFEELGLIQGQRLMLIDLDRCTRCDECVKACVDTHIDGRTRLFLDGPRFDHYLVPTTCRSCLDPVCMVGCPVGSIHRGNNGQIVIEDWCIGCGLCANQCPYGSIQMHDIGVVPQGARGWRFFPASAVGDAGWHLSRYHDDRWAVGQAPFFNNRAFRDSLAECGISASAVAAARDRAVYFRFDFRLAGHVLAPESKFKMELTSTDAAATVWINGKEIAPVKPKAGKREYALPPSDTRAADFLRAGRNVVAVKVTPAPASDEVLLDFRLDAIHRPPGAAEEEITEKLVTERAVVCDLCSSSFGQVPACVNACPHDAAMRVDARSGFPAG
jgi:Fe-S-cluster-containing hydrogenase component 2/CRP-like cAMP-binding protein